MNKDLEMTKGLNEALIADTKDAVLGAFKSIAAHTSTADASIYAAAVTLEIFTFILKTMCEKSGLNFDQYKIENITKDARNGWELYANMLRDEIAGTKIGAKARVMIEVGKNGVLRTKIK